MLTQHGDIFTCPRQNDAICVTTNGMIKNNGKAVMGAGIAKIFDQKFNVSGVLADNLKATGNHAYDLGIYGNGFHIFSLPTKDNWHNDSKIELIEQSCHELVNLMNRLNLNKCYLPLPGCACGHLNPDNVIPLIIQILDDRFVLVLR